MKGFNMINNFASDHYDGLSMVFEVGGRTGSMDAGLERTMRRLLHIICKYETEHLVNNVELLNHFQEAESAGDVDKHAFFVRSLIVQAASDRAVGMTSLAKCAFIRAGKQEGPLSPIWFDEQCRLKRNLFIAAVKRGEAKHACQFLRKESR
eukprot:1160846-Pelagomonas_calceolata.AAC.1